MQMAFEFEQRAQSLAQDSVVFDQDQATAWIFRACAVPGCSSADMNSTPANFYEHSSGSPLMSGRRTVVLAWLFILGVRLLGEYAHAINSSAVFYLICEQNVRCSSHFPNRPHPVTRV